jgi:hexosaminidase
MDASTHTPDARKADESRTPFRWTGFMLDEGRHFFGKETVLAYLDRLAELGFDTFHWHLTEDQGWRLDLPGMPELARCGSVRPSSPLPGEDTSSDGTPYGPFFYTPDDVREVVDYASARAIRVVPEIDLPGHTRALLAAHPEFTCVGATPPRHPWNAYGVCEDVLCAGNDTALAFCERILDAVCDLFPSEFIHIGGDECPRKHWKACPLCQARIRAEGLTDEAALQGWVTRRLVAHLARRGRRAVGWSEILTGGDLPSSTVIQLWHGDIAADAAAAVQKGHDIILSPLHDTYLSIPEGLPNDPYRYRAWVMESGMVLPSARLRAFDPLSFVPPAYADKVLGGECCAWTECIHDRAELDYKVWNRLAAFAEGMRAGLRS